MGRLAQACVSFLLAECGASLFDVQDDKDVETVRMVYSSIGDLFEPGIEFETVDQFDGRVRSMDEKVQASYNLAMVARSVPEGGDFIVENHGLRPLTRLVNNGNDPAKKGAAAALSWIMRRRPHYADMVASYGGVAALLKATRAGSDETRKLSVLALTTMAGERANITWAIARQGGVARMVMLARSGAKEEKAKAIAALAAFSRFNVSDIIVLCGGIAPLITC